MESVVTYRRALHQIPELGNQLPKTQAYITQVLSLLPCQISHPTPSSVCAYFDFGRPTTVALRADMDGLPISEHGDAPYVSCHPGQMHACGHDGHTAILLETAQQVAKLTHLPRNVLLLFQPDEEGQGGALPLCQTGILEQYHVEQLFGLHLWPKVEKGVLFSRPGPLLARANEVNVEIFGKGVHLFRASQGIDAMMAGATYLQKAYATLAKLDLSNPYAFHVGRMQSGTIRNAVSDHTLLQGSLRTYSEGDFKACQTALTTLGEELAQETGCRITLSMNRGYPAVWNPENLYAKITNQLGEKAPQMLDHPVLAAEDFAFYQGFVPAMFAFLGLGDTPELHADNFDFDDQAVLPKGVDYFLSLLHLD